LNPNTLCRETLFPSSSFFQIANHHHRYSQECVCV
jgi:hypothetical protein